MREVYEALAADAPLRDPDGELPRPDHAQVVLLAKCLCRLEDVEANVAAYGQLDERTGAVRPAAEREDRLRKEAADYLDALGMTPRSRARLGLDPRARLRPSAALGDGGSGRVGVSVLLREADGFEGFGPRLEEAPPDALPRRHRAICQVAWFAGAPLPAPWPRTNRSATVRSPRSRTARTSMFQSGKDIVPGLPPAADSLVAAIAALALHGTRARDGLHVIVHQAQKGVEVAPVEGVNRSVVEFDVLLRHCPRSIAQGAGA